METEMSNPLCSAPQGWTECEAYRGFVIAVRNGSYRGFGHNLETHHATTRAVVRRIVDVHLDGVPA
jgi:hypothetical protein